MATQKIFAQHNSRIDLSALGNKNQIQVVISGPDLKLTSPQGSVTIVNGAMYSSLKDSQLSFQFQDGSLKGKDLLSQVNLENIDFKSADAFLVDHVQNKVLQEEQEALKQKMRQAEKAREKAEKEKSEAEKAALEAQEAQKSSQQIEEALNEFLTQANTKAALAQITPDERDISLDSASSLHKESSTTVEVAQVNKNANRSSGLNNPAPNPKIDLKISLALDDKSNSSGQKDNLTNVTSPKLVGTTMPGTEVTIQKGSTTLGSTKADGQGNFTFTPTDLTDGPHEFMALGEYKGNKAQAKLSLVIKSSTQTPTFEMNSEDIALTQEERSDIFLIKNVTPTIHGKAEANTQVSVYNKKSTDDKETRLGTVSVDEKGVWSYSFKDRQLAQGDNSISVVAEDKAKNIAAAKKTINLDSIPPYAPTIELAEESHPKIHEGQTFTRFTDPVLKGTLEAGAKIELYLNGKKITEDISVTEGKWFFKPKKKLAAQQYTITGVAIDERGNRSDERTEENKQGHGEFTFTIDDNVNIGSFNAKIVDKDNTSLQVKDNHNHTITSHTNPGFEGEGKPNSTIIFSNNENESDKQEIKVNEQGKWSLAGFNTPSKGGSNLLKFDIADLYGNKGQFEFQYEIDTIAPESPKNISLKEDFKTIGKNNTQTTAEKQPTLIGTGDSFSWVWIYEDSGLDSGPNNMGKYLDRVKVESDGHWEYKFPESLTPKLHTLKFKAQDAANNFSTKSEFQFNVQTKATILEAYLSEESRSNQHLEWKTKKTSNLKIEGKADPNANITIDINGSKNNVEANNEGNWNTDIGDLSAGEYPVKITSTSQVKDIEPLNITRELWIKTRIESATIEIIEEGGLVSKRDETIITSSTKPRFKITGEAGSDFIVTFEKNGTEAEAEVEVEVEVEVAKEVKSKISQSGDFIVENLDLEKGLYQVKVKLKDDVGNESELSSPYAFTIDTDGITPTIELKNSTEFPGESNKNITKDDIFQFKGQAAPGASISLRQHDEDKDGESVILMKDILASEVNGAWEAEYSASKDSLKDGEYTFSVQSNHLKKQLDSDKLIVTLDRETQIGKIELVQNADDKALKSDTTKSQKPKFKITVPDDVRKIELWAVKNNENRFDTEKFTFTKTNASITNSDKNRLWEMTLDSDLEADKNYTLHVEVTDHASNKKNNWDDASQPYRFYISGALTTPSIAFDNDTKTGKYLDFTNKTEKLGFIVSNVKTVEGQDLPTVQVEIKSLQEEGDSENITAKQREDKKWVAFTENTSFFSKGKYRATVTVTDVKNAKASNTFDFHVKPFIQPTEIELVDESSTEGKSSVKAPGSMTLTYNSPQFKITFDKEDMDSVNIKLENSSDGKTIESKPLTAKEISNGEYIYEPGILFNQKDYILTVTAIDKAGNQNPKAQNFNINSSELQKVDIALHDDDKTGDKKSNFTKNKNPILIFRTQEDNIDSIEIYKKVEGGIEKIHTLESTGGFDPKKDETWQISDNIFDKDGKYIISARPYKGKKQGPTTEIAIDFYQNAPGVQDIQLNAESKSTFDESGIYTNNSKPGFLITVPDGDQQRVWKMQVLVIKKSDDNTLETIEIRDTLFPGNNTQPVNTQKSWSKGTYEIVVTLTDKAGNPSTQKTQTIYFDDTKPKPVIHFHPEASPDKSGEKNIIKNQNRKFVIKGTEEKRIEASDEIEVTLTQINKTSSKETLYHSKKNATLFSYNEGKKEQTFSLDESNAWPKGDFQLNVKVTDRYGNTGISKEPLSFTIQDSVEKPEIGLIDDDDTSYHKKTDVHITNKPKPRFSLTNLDEHATRVDIKTTPPVVEGRQLNDSFDNLAEDSTKKEQLTNSFQLQKEWSDNGDYKLSVNTFVDAEPSPETTLTVLFDNKLKQPQITLDEETRKSSSASESGATVASKTPRFNLLDIEDDVKHILLQVYKNTATEHFEKIEFDIKDLEDTSKREDIERKGIKKTDSGYTYQSSEWQDNAKYKISLTVTDRASNTNQENPAAFEVNIDTAIAKIPSITLNESDNQAFDKIKKFITKNQNPSFKLDNIDDREKTITITIYKLGNTKEILASHTFPKETRTFNVNQLILADKSQLRSLADGQYTIQAAVTLKTKISSALGSLDFTIDHADAPTHTIELIHNTGTIQKPVTNKTTPKFHIKNIAFDRLDRDNPDSIVVTFQKKNRADQQPVIQNLAKSDIPDNSDEFDFTTSTALEQGEYTVTAKVTYQAGQSKSTTLADLNIYTTPPQSRIEFENTEKVRTEGGKNKVQKQDLKFKISVNDDTAMLKKSSSKVKVSLKKGDVKEGPEIEALYNNTENVWKVDLSEKSISKGDYTIEANVTDKHDNTGTSEPMNFYMLDGLLKPEIEIETNDHTPYDPTEYKDNKKITNKTQPTFIIKNIDPEAESVTFSVSKKGVEIPFATRNYKKNEGGWPFFSNTEKIKVEFQDDGDYDIKLDVVGVGGVQQSAKALLLTFNAQVDPPRISLESQKDVAAPLTSEKKPTFLIEQIGEHVREIKIIRESQGEDPVKKEFICKINDKGEVQTLNNDFGGRLTKDPDNTGTYRFTPKDDWPDGTYKVRVEVTNRAKKSAMSNEDNIITLTIDNNLPEVPTIELEPAHNSTYPVSLKQTETWTQNNSPKFNITVKRNDVNPVTKVHVKVKDPGGNEKIEEATKKDGKWTFTPGTSFTTKGAYTLSVQSENQLERTSHFSSDIIVHFNADPPKKPGIRLDSESITGIDNPTEITNKPSPKLSITNINTIQDAVDPDAVEVTLINDSKNQALATNAIARYDSTNNTFFYVQRNLSEGNYTATVKATNKAGIPSEISDPFRFEIDTTAPNPPEIEILTGSYVTHQKLNKVLKNNNQLRFLVKTNAEINDLKYIEVSLDGNKLNKNLLDPTNKNGLLSGMKLYKKNVWEFTYNHPFSLGTHNLLVTVTDKAGNTSNAQDQFMVLGELHPPKIEMPDNTNAAGPTSTPHMINKVNMGQINKRNLTISLDDHTLFPYVEMKAELIPNQKGSSKTTTINLRTEKEVWMGEIPTKQPDGEYTLKVTATDVLGIKKETNVEFVVDTTPPETPTIKLRDSVTKHAESKATQETTQEKPNFVIGSIPNDIYKINIKITGDDYDYDYEVDNPNNVENKLKEWSGIQNALKDNQTYSITVTFTDKAGNTSNNKDDPFQIKKIVPYTFIDPTLILDPETDSGTQGDFKTNHNQPVLLFKNMSDAAVNEVNLKLENKIDKKTYTYSLKDFEPIDVKNSKEYKIELIKESSLTKEAPFPEGEYKVTVELTYANNEQYTKATTFEKPLTINRKKPEAVYDVKYTFKDGDQDQGKTINIEGKKPKNTDIFIQFHGQTEINIKKQNGDSLFSDETFITTQPWGQQKSFTLFVKDDIGNQSENTQVEIPLPPNITKYKDLGKYLEIYIDNSDKKIKEGDKIIIKEQGTEYQYTVISDNLTNNSFQFTTNNAFTDKFTAYVSRAGHESEQIQRTIPKPPQNVEYTFSGSSSNLLVVKGDVKKGQTLNISNNNEDFSAKSYEATRDQILIAIKPLYKNLKKFNVFASTADGGESQIVEKEIPDVFIYWNFITKQYQAGFHLKDAAQYISEKQPREEIGFNFDHVLEMRNGHAPVNYVYYKRLTDPDQPYQVIEFDNQVDYELTKYLYIDAEEGQTAGRHNHYGDPENTWWRFRYNDIDSDSKELNKDKCTIKFIHKKQVMKFLSGSDGQYNDLGILALQAIKKEDENIIEARWDMRPKKISIKKEDNIDGKKVYSIRVEIDQKLQKRNLELIFTNAYNKKEEIISSDYNTNTREFTSKVKGGFEGQGSSGSHKFVRIFLKDRDSGVISYFKEVEISTRSTDDYEEIREDSDLCSLTMFPGSQKYCHNDKTHSKRSLKEEALEEVALERAPEALFSEINEKEKDKIDTSLPLTKFSPPLTEGIDQPTEIEAQQVNPTQPQKEDIPTQLVEEPKAAAPQNPIELNNPITSEENTTADLTPSFTLNAPKEAPDAVKALVTLDNRPEYALELIDNQGVFTVEMPLAEGPHQLKVKFIDPDGDWIRLDKTFTIDASSERILSSLETPDRYQIDLSTGSKTSPSKENADILMMTPVLHLPEHEEESIYYG
ncbi:Ig-like domain-containing protein [Candidatus Hamiltonella endosymbiont of Tuberolachnus salignus]|uniref:Ig-like domain-containing protein n=1 Tax=Candidatus Williamhamiltonella endosymbiont of Tuberolachnus salignus TaxID=3077954 RepID=UPI0030CAFF10